MARKQTSLPGKSVRTSSHVMPGRSPAAARAAAVTRISSPPGGVLAELAGGVDLLAVDVVVADLEDPPVPDAAAQDDLLLGNPTLVERLACALHRDCAGDRGVGLAKQDEEAVGLELDQDAVVLLDDGEEEALLLEDDLQEMDDAEAGHLAGEADQIGEDDRPVLAEEVPDAAVDGVGVGAGQAALLDELPEARRAPFQGVFARHDRPAALHTTEAAVRESAAARGRPRAR